MSKALVEQLRSCARGIGLSLVDQAADRIEELEKALASCYCHTAEHLAEVLAAPAAPAHDREADRQRFPDPDFNRWLDESVSDYHIVWEAVGDIAAAWAGWDNRQFYAAPVAPAGYKLVPIEPTESMIMHGFESAPSMGFSKPEVWDAYEEMSGCQQAAFRAKLCYAAMLAAAPETWKVLPSSAEDARDAARYRWLRACNSGHIGILIFDIDPDMCNVVTEDDADTAIDAAMGGSKP